MLLLLLAVSVARIPVTVARNDTIRCFLVDLSVLAFENRYDFDGSVDEFVSICFVVKILFIKIRI